MLSACNLLAEGLPSLLVPFQYIVDFFSAILQLLKYIFLLLRPACVHGTMQSRVLLGTILDIRVNKANNFSLKTKKTWLAYIVPRYGNKLIEI